MRGPRITIDRRDDQGVFGVVIEKPGQDPILLETEGYDTSLETAHSRARRAFGERPTRYCIVRLIPVEGNELLLLDMQRMQQKEAAE